MPVHVKCPTCSSVLAAPSKMVGSVVACPQCHNQLMVPAAAAPPVLSGTATTSAAPPLTAAVSGNVPIQSTTATIAAPNERTQFYPPGMTPPTNKSAPNLAPSALPPIPTAPPLSKLSPPVTAYPPGSAPPISTLPPGSLASLPPKAPPRQTQAAKFIAADTTATKVDLGADGRLPTLVLEELAEDEKIDEKPAGSNPLLLVGVLGFSILASIVMLFVDPSSGPSGSVSKAEARRTIQEYYLPDRARLETGNVRLKPYQQRLRDALLAYNRGDLAEERQLYRQVLDMLHAEDKNKDYGITGNLSDNQSDRHLENLVSALLSN